LRNNIFHKLVVDEDNYTQLLCNLMVRFDDLRRTVLGLFLGDRLASRIEPHEIRTQICLPECGRPDIVIQAPRLFAVLEVKVSPVRDLTSHQSLTGDYTYGAFLSKYPTAERWVLLLVPERWVHSPKAGNPSIKYGFIKHKTVTWERVLDVITHTKDQRDPFVDEFRSLLSDRFGPLTFSEEEEKMRPIDWRTARKLETVVDEIKRRGKDARYSCSLSQDRDDYGIDFRNQSRKYALWFGIWADFWEEHEFPLCFCFADTSKLSVPNLEKSFTKGCRSKPIHFDGYTVVGIRIQPQSIGNDVVDSIWSQLEPVLAKICRNSARR